MNIYHQEIITLFNLYMLDLSLDDRIILNSPIDCAIQELDLLFNTTNTELINNVDYGTNFEQFTWQLVPSTDDIKRYIRERISVNTVFVNQFDYDVEVMVNTENYRDSYYVNINLNVETDDPDVQARTRRVYMLQQ